jgi:endogenous inhibitor of DNA gyrase (YacG/DUF329 family)
MFDDKVNCPDCGEKGLPKIWNGFYPPVCDKCGGQAETVKVSY